MSLPYFPMYPTDFEAKTSHLTLAEDGAYNRLLRICWMTPGCSIPDDDDWIMRRLRVDQDTFVDVVKVVISEFFVSEKGRLSNAKLSRIFEETNDAHQKRVSAGSKGGKAKSLKSNNSGSSNAVAKPKQPEPEPEPDKEDKSSLFKDDEKYQRYLKAHPKPVDSDAGLSFFSALLERGTDAEQIIGAAKAYAETIKGWNEVGKVQQADNFLDPERGQWEKHIPKSKPQTSEAEILDYYANVVLSKKRTAPSAVNSAMAGRLLAANKVTPEQLAAAGVIQ